VIAYHFCPQQGSRFGDPFIVPKYIESQRHKQDEQTSREERQNTLFKKNCKVENSRSLRAKDSIRIHGMSLS